MTLVMALANIDAPVELIHWTGTRTTVEALRDCPRPEWIRWIKNADIEMHRKSG